jgi:hypothetical protein
MNPQTEFESLLRQHKFKLVSEKKHYKFADPAGRILITSKTPSDYRAYRNMVSVLRRVVAAPPPSNAVIEEMRQRKELEEYIRLNPAKKSGAGIAGKGKNKKSRGTGFIYVDTAPVPFVPDEVREAARNNERWDSLIHHVKKQRKQIEAELRDLYKTATIVVRMGHVRDLLKRTLCETRANSEEMRRNVRDQWWKGSRHRTLIATVQRVSRVTENTVESPGEALFTAMQSFGEVEMPIRYDEDEDRKAFAQDFADQTAAVAAYLWEVSDYRKPSWLIRFIPDGTGLPADLRRAVRMVLREFEPQREKVEEHMELLRRLLRVNATVDSDKAA